MRIVFMGSGDIGLPSLHRLLTREDVELVAVVTQPDRPAGRGRKLHASQVKVAATEAGIPVLQPEKLRHTAAVEELASHAPDVIVVMACLNLHASLLPRHRGASPIQAAIAAGDPVTGITVMFMAEGLDTGDMLLTRSLDILPTDTGGSLHDRLAGLAPEALDEALDRLASGTASRTPQDDAAATYAGRLRREDGRIDWTQPAGAIERHIRAMNPWPAAFTQVPVDGAESARLKVFSATVDEVESAHTPGTVVSAEAEGLRIAAADRVVRLEEVQGEGGRRMSSAEWLRGRSVTPGARCE